MAKKPKVSILCLTYNHKKYIKQALDGFLMQKTDFGFEILINDDHSIDGTTDIIKEYARRHPGVIKPVFQSANQYSQGKRNFFARFLIPKAEGKYLALCEGDDYWTDPNKLQMQADFLDRHPKYSVCFHRANVVYERYKGKDFVFPDVEDESWYTLDELMRTNYIPTNSVMYRKQRHGAMTLSNISPADWYLHLYHAQYGKIKFMSQVMSVYRKHKGGAWWDYDNNRDEIWKKHGLEHLNMLYEALKIYGGSKHKNIIRSNITNLIKDLSRVDDKYGTQLMEIVGREHSDRMVDILRNVALDAVAKDKKITEMWRVINDLRLSNKDLTEEVSKNKHQ